MRECVCVPVCGCCGGGAGREGGVTWHVVERETEKKDRENLCVCAYIKK